MIVASLASVSYNHTSYSGPIRCEDVDGREMLANLEVVLAHRSNGIEGVV